MTRGKTIVLAVFTAWPLAYFVLFLGVFMGLFFSIFKGPTAPAEPPTFFIIVVPLHLLTMLDIFVLLFVYIRYLFKTDTVPEDKKALWAVVLFLGNMISMPIFWYLYIWKCSGDKIPDQMLPPDRQESVPASP